MYCKNCGFNNNDSCNFCVNCGRPLKGEQPAGNGAQARNAQRAADENPKTNGTVFIIAVIAIALVVGGAAFGIVHHLMTSHHAQVPDYTASEDDVTYDDGTDRAGTYDSDDENKSGSNPGSNRSGSGYSNSADYIIPGSGSDLLRAGDLSGLSKRDIQYAINEIYARHGAEFDDPQVKSYFSSKSWYNAYQSKDEAHKDFNSTESKNADFMRKYLDH